MDAAAKSVHAQVMDPEGKVLRQDGDLQLRRSYSSNMRRLMREAGSRPVQDAVDLGCATGDRCLRQLCPQGKQEHACLIKRRQAYIRRYITSVSYIRLPNISYSALRCHSACKQRKDGAELSTQCALVKAGATVHRRWSLFIGSVPCLTFCVVLGRPVHNGVAACLPRGRHLGIGPLAALPGGRTAFAEREGGGPIVSA